MVKSGQTWAGIFSTKDSTGALATPSAGPAGVLYVDGTANGASVTITGSNPYKWSVTLPTLTAGQSVSMYITATIASIATSSIVREDVADTVRLSDLSTLTQADIRTAIGLASANLDTQLSTISEYIDTEVAAIKAKTDNLPASPAASSDIPSAATIADAVWDEVLTGATHNIATSAGRRLRQLGDTIAGTAITGTLTTTSFTTDITGYPNNAFKHQVVYFTSGTLIGQTQVITAYNGTTGLITVEEAFTSAPSNGNSFDILAQHVHSMAEIADEVHTELQTEFEDLAALLNSGIYSYSDTVTDGTDPLDGVQVELYSDSGLTTFITKTTTNSIGQFTVYSDTAGTHYLSLQKAGYVFPTTTVTLA